MIRFCPNCATERPLFEMFCEGSVDGRRCDWSLAEVPIRPAGWRPAVVVPVQPPAPDEPPLTCTNGHAMDAGDLICAQCGADAAAIDGPAPQSDTTTGTPASWADDAPATTAPDAAAAPSGQETIIEGWRVLRQMSSTVGLRDRYLVEEADGERRGVLTLYHQGAEPDPSVYDALKRVSKAHVLDIFATGRWNERAYEVAEALTGGTLADLGIVATGPSAIRQIVYELGRALDALAEVGLRHRDLRPGTLLVRHRDPLDLVIGGYGSARLSEFDLDIVSPLEITRYTAPEAVAGGVAAASDWWSLGMVLLEQVTQGRCFEGIHHQAFLIHVLANGAPIPDDLDPATTMLLRGLLTRDRLKRWGWPQVQAWLDGKPIDLPAPTQEAERHHAGPAIALGGARYHAPRAYALAAAEAGNWEEAREQLLRSVVVSWAQDAGADASVLAGLRRVARHETLEEDFRLLAALKILNPEIPPIHRGDIVTPRWLLAHPLEAYALITGELPDLLDELGTESWLSQLKARAHAVRTRARHLAIELDEDSARIHLLSTSRAKLAAEWEARRRLLPDTEHHGLLGLMERRTLGEEDLIVLLSASIGQFRSCDALVEEARLLALANGVHQFSERAAQELVRWPRNEIMQAVAERTEGFARCANPAVNGWADDFRLERRIPIARALVLLSIPQAQWQALQKQAYVTQILDFFEKKIVSTVMRGPLVRMTIGKTTTRVDLAELRTPRMDPAALLDHLLQRNDRAIALDPAAFDAPESSVRARLQSLERHTQLHKRDTGIDGLYLGFPFLLTRDAKAGATTRIAPVLLWPARVHHELGSRGRVNIAFDSEREEVRLNPALEGLVGPESIVRWRKAVDELLGRSALRAADVIDALGNLATPRNRSLMALPNPKVQVPVRSMELECAAVLFHVTFIGQAIGEDIRQLKSIPSAGTGLETALRLNTETPPSNAALPTPREADRFFTVHSDPSQEEAVLRARAAPGLVVEGPPGTGKSQTIVNMVGDAIGRRQSLLIVCQKHAALEVVHKRLVAEGLGNRVVMINDVNKDRNPVIKAVREQVEALLRRKTDPAAPIRRSRQETGARIEALEGALDRHHLALHHIDERIGVSYRTLLGELIRLESPKPPLDVPALRSRLERLNSGELATLEEEIAPIVRHWLPARIEGSALAQLQPFAADPATLADFGDAFQAFAQAEATRSDELVARQAGFEVDDPAPHRQWLATHGRQFLDLADDDRARLARWLRLFRAPPAPPPAQEIMDALGRVRDTLAACSIEHHDLRLSPVLCRMPTDALEQLRNRAAEAMPTASILARLNPMRYLRKRRLQAFLVVAGDIASPARIDALLAATQLELQLRPLRTSLQNLHVQLQLPEVGQDAVLDLAPTVAGTLHALQRIALLASHLAAAPWPDALDKTALLGSREAFLRLYAEYDSAFARCEMRASSQAALQRLDSWMQPDWLAACAQAIARNETAAGLVRPIQAALPTLAAYQHFRGRAARLSEEALAILGILRTKEAQLAALPAPELEGEVRRLVNREARLGWKRAIEQATPELVIEREELEAKVSHLAALDEQMRTLNRQLLREDYDLAAIRPLKEWEDITRLTGQRARRLREFIESGAGLGLMALRPVWLMNPDVASRVLPLKAALFDTIIYDEASQMPVEYALPSLYRARVTVVSGDEKQMPPTAFFASKVESDEAQAFDGEGPDEDATEEERETFDETWNRREIKDCPDLLQLARTSLPNSRLQIHYRSAYRELINYSNAAFYGNDLSVPVRHSDKTIASVRPIEMVRVDGVYQDQTNPAEAERVVDILAELWKQPYADRPSVGIVTFNRRQADLIEEALEARAEIDADFRAAYRLESQRNEDGEDMAVFVKNVENVQGDERDVIVFSSTFGRNQQGTFRRFFGVLGQKGGERRLNVAVTRSRRKIYMVTSMPINDISDALATRRKLATPRDFLQGYMAYARSISCGDFASARALLSHWAAPRPESAQAGRHAEDGFSLAVGEYLKALGRTVAAATADDAFGLDFAIEHPSTGLFAIGIECDSPRHDLLRQARAREVWRPAVLRRAVPVIHRVSSQGWYHDGAAERRRLQEAIDKAMALGASQ
ncbi:AAA domain-containing protein [Pseudorhodoferax sp.]|uniref:AAA domain-containing protein n=1 Tax=Pseudorhodoferax sp. TaxID=1993553 RepID=UPI0039E2CFDB